MRSRPEFWIVAGPNGAGKTTCCQKSPITELIPGLKILNPDDRALQNLRQIGIHSFSAAQSPLLIEQFIVAAEEVYAEVQAAIQDGQSIGVETVLSTVKYRSLVEQALLRRTYFGLIYVALSSADLACQRVAGRVSRGGHDVPSDRTRQRWLRSLEQLPWFARQATDFWIIDNSDSVASSAPRLIAYGSDGRITAIDSATFPEMRQALSTLVCSSTGTTTV